MEGAVTIQDIARLAGVSKSTVSRYLNHGYVSREKSGRIRAIIEETGFKSNFFARRLKTRCSKLVGIVLPRLDSVTVGKMLSGITAVLEPNGYQGLILASRLRGAQELENMRSLAEQGADGLLVISTGITAEHHRLLRRLSLPVVFAGQSDPGIHYIKIDDYGAGRIMGKYMREKGHRRVVFAGVSETDRAVGIDRKQGFIEAFCENLPEASVAFVETGFAFEHAYAKGAEIMSFQPTAVVCATDNIGLGMLRYLHEHKLRVPGQVSVTGFGGYPVGAVAYPGLTTVQFDYEFLGEQAARGLLRLLAGEEMLSDSGLPLNFIERESVKAISREPRLS